MFEHAHVFKIPAVCLYVPLPYSSALCWWTSGPRSELWGAPLRQRTHRTYPRRLSRCRTRSGTSKHTDTICSTDPQAANGYNIISENRYWMDDRGSIPHKKWDLPPLHQQYRLGAHQTPPQWTPELCPSKQDPRNTTVTIPIHALPMECVELYLYSL
jgi:hypothetical protein